MDARRLSILGLAMVACAQGSLEPGTSFNPTVGTMQPGDSGDDEGDDADDGDDDGSETTGGGEGSASVDDGGSTGADPTTNEGEGTTDPASASAEDESTSDPPPMETSTTDPGGEEEAGSDTDPGMLPDAGPYEDCTLPDCEAGNDCLGIVGLDDYAPYCSPQCTEDADCPAGGTAAPSCILSEEGAPAPTNCVLLCEYDNEVLGNCPTGMTCADLPGQTTQVGLCMWM